ncbi:hypothetical protein BFC17_12025 [Alteromonas lipolytica]|uniref:Glycosyl transferase n=1 Tax=Alteromonas lipolytica TaxID=1856405 RepID=A0A1E8FJT2_9ALTE|nr:hypothetical protein BFC17_12025 [Alteromonas lipolytica]
MAILVSYSGSGGVEVITNHLVEGLVNAGVKVDLLLLKTRGPHFAKLVSHPLLTVTKLSASSAILAIPEIKRYLQQHPDKLLLAVKDRAIQAAALASKLAGSKSRVIGQLHNNMQVGLANRPAIAQQIRFALMRRLYSYTGGVIAVSADAAQSLVAITNLPASKVTVLANPVVTPALLQKARLPASHPWLVNKTLPVIVAAGRLSPQKNFALLLRAFAEVRRSLPVRLIIFGEGPQRQALEELANTLGISEQVSLYGFIANPYAEMRRADLFVLSSDWEGSPTVLTECLALGVPCVSTDVGDVTETLRGGETGRVVPRGESELLAAAMLDTLNNPLPANTLQAAVHKFHQDVAVARYIALLRRLHQSDSQPETSDNKARSFDS